MALGNCFGDMLFYTLILRPVTAGYDHSAHLVRNKISIVSRIGAVPQSELEIARKSLNGIEGCHQSLGGHFDLMSSEEANRLHFVYLGCAFYSLSM